MSKVIFNVSMSLDGYVAGPNDGLENGLGDGGENLFNWYNNGEIRYKTPGGKWVFNFSPLSAKNFEERVKSIGAIITGKRTFDIARAWNGQHPVNVPIIVLTHHIPEEWINKESPFIFITDGIEHATAEAKKIAGKKNVSISTASTFQQCLKLGLVDEIHIDLTPVILGSGVHLFDFLNKNMVKLKQLNVIEGKEVVHLRYSIEK